MPVSMSATTTWGRAPQPTLSPLPEQPLGAAEAEVTTGTASASAAAPATEARRTRFTAFPPRDGSGVLRRRDPNFPLRTGPDGVNLRGHAATHASRRRLTSASL